jgi:hypothetical protein
MNQTIAQPSGPTTATPARAWRSVAVVALSYVVASMLASTITSPAHPALLSPEKLLLSVLAGLLGAVAIGPLAARLRLPFGPRLTVVLLLAYLLGTLTNEVEALLFIKGSSTLVPVTGAVLALGIALPVTILYPPARTDLTVGAALRGTLGSRPWWSWLWRIALASLLWVPVYFVFAAADAPFVHRYYHQTGTSFTIPSNGVLVAAELSRGVLHALVLGALAALLVRNRRTSWFWLALAFAALNAWLPLVQRADWPYYLRAANIVEITCDAVCYGGLVVLLLSRRGRSDAEPVGVAGS